MSYWGQNGGQQRCIKEKWNFIECNLQEFTPFSEIGRGCQSSSKTKSVHAIFGLPCSPDTTTLIQIKISWKSQITSAYTLYTYFSQWGTQNSHSLEFLGLQVETLGINSLSALCKIKYKDGFQQSLWPWIWQWILKYDTKITIHNRKKNHRLHQKFKFVYQKNIRKVKRQSTELEKILVNYISDKSLVSRIYKELII